MPSLQIIKRHGYFFLGTLAAVILSTVVGVVFLSQQSLILSIDSLLNQYNVGFILWRLALYAALIGYWPHLITKFKGKPNFLQPSRWLVISGVVAYELIIVHNALAVLFHAMTS